MELEKPIHILDRILEQAMEEDFNSPVTVECWQNGRLCIQETVSEDSDQEDLLMLDDQPWKSGDKILVRVISNDGRCKEIEFQLISSKPS